MPKKKIAIVCDRLDTWGGAEFHMREITKILPEADIFTSVADSQFIQEYFPGRTIYTTFIQKLPFQKALKQEYVLLQPLAFSRLNFSKYDLIISISSGFAKNINTPRHSKHIYICLTPPRFLWLEKSRKTTQSKKITYNLVYKIIKKPLHNILRKTDYKSAQKPRKILANSKTIVKRVKKYYDRDAQYIYPPVDLKSMEYHNEKRDDKYLYLGRIDAYKGVELAIRACVKLGKKLVVAGTGPDMERMQQLVKELNAGNLINFLGFVSDKTKVNLYNKCRALIFPVLDEDFGIVPVEAQACGCPVIAYRSGGVRETVSDKLPQTGVFFGKYSSHALALAIRRFEKADIDPRDCVEQAKMFSTEIFAFKMREYLKNELPE